MSSEWVFQSRNTHGPQRRISGKGSNANLTSESDFLHRGVHFLNPSASSPDLGKDMGAGGSAFHREAPPTHMRVTCYSASKTFNSLLNSGTTLNRSPTMP